MGPAIHAAKGAELYALATSDPEKAKGFTAFCPTLTVHSSYDALLADPLVDAVYVPLPNHMHVEWALKALAAGKHVLVEKPIAMQADEIDQIIAARDASGLLAAEAYMIVHHPQWQRAKEWLEAGEIGTLRHVDAAFSFHLTDGENIRLRPETGGGSLRDIGVYTFGSARFVTGSEPVDISARLIRENGVDIFAQVAGIMDGPHGRFTYGSMTSMRLYNRQVVTFQGDQGHDPAGGRAVQRQCQRSGRGGTAPERQPGDHRTLPHRQPLCAAGRGVWPFGARKACPMPARWNSSRARRR